MNTVEEIVQTLANRGGRLEWHNGKLMVYPKDALDEPLRQQMRSVREELHIYAKLYCTSLLHVVDDIFKDVLTHNQRLEDHLPATILLPCWGRKKFCKIYTEKQLLGHTPTQLYRKGEGCGDCDLFRQKLIQENQERKRMEEAEKRTRERRSNRFALEANHHEEED